MSTRLHGSRSLSIGEHKKESRPPPPHHVPLRSSTNTARSPHGRTDTVSVLRRRSIGDRDDRSSGHRREDTGYVKTPDRYSLRDEDEKVSRRQEECKTSLQRTREPHHRSRSFPVRLVSSANPHHQGPVFIARSASYRGTRAWILEPFPPPSLSAESSLSSLEMVPLTRSEYRQLSQSHRAPSREEGYSSRSSPFRSSDYRPHEDKYRRGSLSTNKRSGARESSVDSYRHHRYPPPPPPPPKREHSLERKTIDERREEEEGRPSLSSPRTSSKQKSASRHITWSDDTNGRFAHDDADDKRRRHDMEEKHHRRERTEPISRPTSAQLFSREVRPTPSKHDHGSLFSTRKTQESKERGTSRSLSHGMEPERGNKVVVSRPAGGPAFALRRSDAGTKDHEAKADAGKSSTLSSPPPPPLADSWNTEADLKLQRQQMEMGIQAWLNFVVPKWYKRTFRKEDSRTARGTPPFLSTHVRPGTVLQLGQEWSESKEVWRAAILPSGRTRWLPVDHSDIASSFSCCFEQVVHSPTEKQSVVVAVPKALGELSSAA